MSELSFEQLQKEATNLYTVLHSNDNTKYQNDLKNKNNTRHNSQKLSMDCGTINNGQKKGFKIKKQQDSD